MLRLGLPVFGARFFKLEELLHQYDVDLTFWAHEHSYERLWPTYNQQVFNGTSHPDEPYRNARAPVHVITGAAGCREGHGRYVNGPRGPWSAVRNSEWGFGRLLVPNRTHLGWEQVEDINGTVVDSFWLVKDRQQSFKSAAPHPQAMQESERDLQTQIFARTEPCTSKLDRLPSCVQTAE